MSEQDSSSVSTAPPNQVAAWTFFLQWAKHPLTTASMVPSGRQLTRQMMRQLPADARHVVELGAGTGVFTQALIEHGIAPEDLLVVELNPEFHGLLCRRFPALEIMNGDARDLQAIVARAGMDAGVDAVVSGLGFLAMPREIQKQILEAVFAVLGKGRSLIQFTYGPKAPIPQDLLEELGLTATRVGFAPLNLPPAFVYKLSRRAD